MIPVLKWNNPGQAKRRGDKLMLLFARKGHRPVASFNVYPNGNGLTHVFCSYFEKSLVCKLDGEDVWHPDESRLQFQPMPKTSQPHSSPVRQRIQIKALARRFTANTSRQAAASKSEVPELRLLPRPLLQYQHPEAGVTIGAVFGFRLGGGGHTHVLLFIEAARNRKQLQWQYAYARCNRASLTGLLDGQEVWSVPALLTNLFRDTDSFYKLRTAG